jgi:hypothetical protein
MLERCKLAAFPHIYIHTSAYTQSWCANTFNIIIRIITECPGLNELQNLFEDLLEENAVEHVRSTDRSTAETTKM